MARLRLDEVLIRRRLAQDRREAVALLLSGRVAVADFQHPKAGILVDEAVEITVRPPASFVSRGGRKLEPALRYFQIDPTDLTCVDLGASTGGFTDCLLQHGARRVYAFDVGRGQLDWSLRNNPKVEVREGFNVRFISPPDIGEAVQLIVADLSFISLRLIIPQLREFSDASCVLLVKPQFEAEAHEVEKGGLITDPGLREEIVMRIRTFAEREGFVWRGTFLSPVPGQKGNREYFLHLEPAFRRSPDK